MRILGTNHVGKTRRDALKDGFSDHDVKLRHVYAERLASAFLAEIQSQHFGGSNMLSMEGIALDYIKNDEDFDIVGEFFSYLSDDSYQDAATTTAHMSHLIQQLLMSKRIEGGKSTIMEDTDGCAKQY